MGRVDGFFSTEVKRKSILARGLGGQIFACRELDDMTTFDEAVMAKALAMVRAWERLHDPERSGSLNFGDFFDLAIAAGYSEEEAQKAANRRGWDRLSAGETM